MLTHPKGIDHCGCKPSVLGQLILSELWLPPPICPSEQEGSITWPSQLIHNTQLTVLSFPHFPVKVPTSVWTPNLWSTALCPSTGPWLSAFLEQTFPEFENVNMYSWPPNHFLGLERNYSWKCLRGEKGRSGFPFSLNCKLTLKNIKDNKLEIQLPGWKPEPRTLGLDLHLNLQLVPANVTYNSDLCSRYKKHSVYTRFLTKRFLMDLLKWRFGVWV